jgi:hypothetical protein
MTNEEKMCEYQFSTKDADILKVIACLPNEKRMFFLSLYLKRNGQGALINLFSQFIGLANSVVSNNRVAVENILIIEGGMHPYSAEKANLPTIFGALSGVELAEGINQKKTCGGCAFRLGACANQSFSTISDTKYCLMEKEAFMCHEGLNDGDEPKKSCAGFAQKFKGVEP